jgi:hypothetical protein
MKKKNIIILGIVLTILIGVGLFFFLTKFNKSERWVSWEPSSRGSNPYAKRFTQEAEDTTKKSIVTNTRDCWIGETSGNGILYFPADHLPCGRALNGESNVINIWENSRFVKGDTVTLCLPWGQNAKAVIDSVIFECLEYHDFSHYLYTAKIFSYSSSKPYDNKRVDNCIVIPNNVNIKKRFDFSDILLAKEDIIKYWIDIKYRELVNEWNENINEHDAFNKNIPQDTILNKYLRTYKFSNMYDSTNYMLIITPANKYVKSYAA